jgi:release factor glutamine methyltransferase
MKKREILKSLKQNLSDFIPERVLVQYARAIFEDLALNHPKSFDASELMHVIERIKNQEPIHYITQRCFFHGMPLYVDNRVLIPRPETEELVEWVLDDHRDLLTHIRCIDMGTGSGCIPIVLKKNRPKWAISGVDISKNALDVAKINASEHDVLVDWIEMDLLNENHLEKFIGSYDIIISNPPYVLDHERSSMSISVSEFEPSVALFVPNDDPLLFYRTILEAGKTHLKQNGVIYFEIHQSLAGEILEIGKELGYEEGTLRADMQGNNRMIRFRA